MLSKQIIARIRGEDDTKRAFNSASRNAKAFQNQLAATGKASRTMTRQSRAQFGQLGHQIQDVAVQLQMGMNPLMVFGQQGSQVASVFGAKGALVGGIIAVAAAISGPLIAALQGGTRSLKEMKDEVLELVDSFEDMTLQERNIVSAGFADELDKQKAKIVTLNHKLMKEAKIRDALNETIRGGKQNILGETRAIAESQARTKELNAEMAVAVRKKEELEKKLYDTENAYKKLTRTTATLNLPTPPKTHVDRIGDLADKYRTLVSPQHQFKQTQMELNELVQAGVISQAQMNAYLERMNKPVNESKTGLEQYAEAARDAEFQLDSLAVDAMGSLEDGLLGVVTGTKKASDAFKDMARSIISDLIRIQIRKSILGPLSSGLDSLVGNVGTAMKYGTNVGSEQTSMLMDQNFNGGGFTGRGVRSGGLDGKGGFPAMLHPNETVIDHTKGQSSGVTVVQNINISTGVQQTVRNEIATLMPQIANASKQAVLDARRRGGNYAAAFGA